MHVDLSLGDRRIPIEIKYRRRIDPLRDALGVPWPRYSAPLGGLVSLSDEAGVLDPRIVRVSLASSVLMR